MYERRNQPPISRSAFRLRLLRHMGIVLAVLIGSMGIGMAGYGWLEELGPADAFLHSASVLGGLGLVEVPASVAGKLFASFYALYSGLVFVIAFGIIVTPIIHRILHKFHWESDHAGHE
ncbi:hypothetical protein [Chelativorans sp. AA-79]|uniref:hypothetical protein n=1 Tax=Chelativorans sp. AA-79 TaxID=3028735 RepID=UPI0023F66DF7|nr:hypothetical protein [Chelativorans sp. AA-79]WEX11218.1 hypothetical protein PVE73_09925 [Chelativorans sp. AA-79]